MKAVKIEQIKVGDVMLFTYGRDVTKIGHVLVSDVEEDSIIGNDGLNYYPNEDGHFIILNNNE